MNVLSIIIALIVSNVTIAFQIRNVRTTGINILLIMFRKILNFSKYFILEVYYTMI